MGNSLVYSEEEKVLVVAEVSGIQSFYDLYSLLCQTCISNDF